MPLQPAAEFFGDDPGLQTAQADAAAGGRLAQGFDEGNQVGPSGQITAVSRNFNAGEDDLTIALRLQSGGLFHRFLQR